MMRPTEKTSGKRRVLRLLAPFLSILGLVILLSRLDMAALTQVLRGLDYRYFLISLVLGVATQFFPPWRWVMLLNQRITFWHSCSATFVGDFVNALTPLRMGELVRAGLIHRSQQIALPEALSSIILSQVFDALGLVLLGGILVVLAPLPESLLRALLLIGGITLVSTLVLLLLVRWSGDGERRLEPALTPLVGAALGARLLRWWNHALSGLQILQSPVQLFFALAITIVMWFILALSGWVLVLGLTDQPALLLGVAVAFAGGIGRLIPALPGSIGTLDFAVLLSLTTLGVPDDTAIAFVVLLRLRYTIITILTGSLGLIAEGLNLSSLRQVVSAPRP